MAEEGIKNQSKKIKLKEEEEEEDRISNLQDCLLVEILSFLPTIKDAVKTSKLSKRWTHLWPLLPNLIFIHDSWDADYPHVLYDFYSSVEKTIAQCRHLSLKKFQLHTFYDSQFESRVNDYIRYAVKCNVQELDLSLENIRSNVTFKLDEMVFKSSCFVCLKLSFGYATCVFEPIGAISWNKLRTLCISRIKLDEGVIENILSGSPLLESFKLHDCYGFKRIDITSKSVENLVFSGYIDLEDLKGDVHAMEINAPNILTLKIEGGLFLTKLLLLNVSSLVKADLDYTNGWRVGTRPKLEETKMLKGLILSLRHVKELKIGISRSKALSCLEAKGFTFPSNMKYPDITSCLSSDSEDESTSRLSSDSEDESTSRLSSDSEDESTSRLSSDSEDESTSRLSSDSEDES